MASGEPNQKRKRGRPPRASIASAHDLEDAPAREPAATATVAEPNAAPKKRGRPRKSIDPPTLDEDPAANQPEPEPSTMAPKKRGRPRKSIDPVTQDEHPAANQADNGPSNTTPKKRGRPPKSRDPEPEEEALPEAPPRKRRRAGEAEETEEGQVEREANTRSKSGKASANGPPQAADPEEQSTEETTSRRSRRNRQSDGSPAQSPQEPEAKGGDAQKAKGKLGRKPAGRHEQPAEEDQTTEETSTRRSRRERRSADDNGGNQASPAAVSADKQAPVPKRKRGRPSLAEMAVSKAQNQTSPQAEHQEKKRGRGRPPRASNEAASPKQAASPSSPKPAKKNPPNRQAPSEPSPAAPNPRHLTTLTRHIPRSTIASTWTPLTTPSITAISSLLTDSARPVLHRLRDRDQRHAQAASILRTFSARLHSKLLKGMPFPPASVPASRGRKKGGGGGGGHETELDFERTVDAIAGLERALDPLVHSVVLLRGEKEREERALEREYAVLRRLEGNARAQVRGWREGRGREHVLVGGVMGRGEEAGDGERLEVVARGEGGAGGVFKDLQEEELLALSQQIGNHMESMKSNLGQIEGVLPAIAKSRAALQGTLCEHLDPEQYEQVLLG